MRQLWLSVNVYYQWQISSAELAGIFDIIRGGEMLLKYRLSGDNIDESCIAAQSRHRRHRRRELTPADITQAPPRVYFAGP